MFQLLFAALESQPGLCVFACLRVCWLTLVAASLSLQAWRCCCSTLQHPWQVCGCSWGLCFTCVFPACTVFVTAGDGAVCAPLTADIIAVLQEAKDGTAHAQLLAAALKIVFVLWEQAVMHGKHVRVVDQLRSVPHVWEGILAGLSTSLPDAPVIPALLRDMRDMTQRALPRTLAARSSVSSASHEDVSLDMAALGRHCFSVLSRTLSLRILCLELRWLSVHADRTPAKAVTQFIQKLFTSSTCVGGSGVRVSAPQALSCVSSSQVPEIL
jgi:hypothetical protein